MASHNQPGPAEMISKYYVYVFMSASAEMEMCMILEKSAVISILVSKWPGP